MIAAPRHTISVTVGGKQIYGWSSYNISLSLTDGAGTFSIAIPFRREVFDLVQPDRPLRILIDNIPIMTGFVDDRTIGLDEESITFYGRDKVGRLVQESAPGITFAGLDTHALIAKLASPWFPKVTPDAGRNRKVSLGRGHKARPSNKPRRTHRTHRITRTEPGQTRWQVIEEICSQARLLAWSSGDGAELIVAKPDYEQAPQFRFFKPASGSRRSSESTVLGMGVRDSTGDRYSRVIVVGSGGGTSANYGKAVSSRYGEAKNNPKTPEGDGLDFTAPKRLVVQRDVVSVQAARDEAALEMAKRDGAGHTISVKAQGHGQVLNGSPAPTLFALDTLAAVEDERTGHKGVYLITAVNFQSDRQSGEVTTLELVRKGTELAP